MILNLLLDLILTAIILGGLRYGYNKGLFKMVTGPIKKVLCLFFSFSYSSIIGNLLVAPLIIGITSNKISILSDKIVYLLSTAIAFFLLLIFAKFSLSFTISIIDGIINEGIVEIFNRGAGIAFAGIIAFGLSVCLASLFEYFTFKEFFKGVMGSDSFHGGPIYRSLTYISPIRQIILP